MSERSKILACAFALATCVGVNAPALAQGSAFTLIEVADFDIPWAMAFLPDGRMLVTEQRGVLKLYTPGKGTAEISGVPDVPIWVRAAWATWCCIRTSPTTSWCI